MELAIPLDSARHRFFNEDGDMLPPFRIAGWRGCLLDRDRYDHARLPPLLFDAIVAAAGPDTLLLERYAPDAAVPDAIAPEWTAYRAHLHRPDRWCLEFVLSDAGGRWAVLADADAIVVGAQAALADAIEANLKTHGTSFAELTAQDWGGFDGMRPEWIRYVRAILDPAPP